MFAFSLLLLFFLFTTLTTHRPPTINCKDRVRLRQLLQNWNVNFKMSNTLRSERDSDVTYWWMPLNCAGPILISDQLLIQTLKYEASIGHCFPKLLWILGEPSPSFYNITPIPFDNTWEWKKRGREWIEIVLRKECWSKQVPVWYNQWSARHFSEDTPLSDDMPWLNVHVSPFGTVASDCMCAHSHSLLCSA